MRITLFSFFLLSTVFLNANPVSANTIALIVTSVPASSQIQKKIIISKAEKLSDRKFSLKEKIERKLLQWKLKNKVQHSEKIISESEDGKLSEVLGTIALTTLLTVFIPYLGILSIASIPLAILAIVRGKKAQKKNPEDKKAKTGIILGIITLSFIVLSFMLALFILMFRSLNWK